jgi:large subunit ribosomal protein L25
VQVRKQGFVPGCVYGHDMDSTPIQVSYSKLQQILKKGALKLEVSIDGKKQLAAIEEVQRNPGDGKLVHISFHALKQNEKTWMHVPLHLEGESAGVKSWWCYCSTDE